VKDNHSLNVGILGLLRIHRFDFLKEQSVSTVEVTRMRVMPAFGAGAASGGGDCELAVVWAEAAKTTKTRNLRLLGIHVSPYTLRHAAGQAPQPVPAPKRLQIENEPRPPTARNGSTAAQQWDLA